MKYNRIMIFGRPGSGKSTFALALSHYLNIPLYHLDKYFFIENWVERENEEFLALQQKMVEEDYWIIDGNAIRSFEMRYARADLVLYFCSPRLLCLARLIKRRFFKDSLIQDRAKGCEERLRFRLVRYMWTFDEQVGPSISTLRKRYPNIHFHKICIREDLEFIQKILKTNK